MKDRKKPADFLNYIPVGMSMTYDILVYCVSTYFDLPHLYLASYVCTVYALNTYEIEKNDPRSNCKVKSTHNLPEYTSI